MYYFTKKDGYAERLRALGDDWYVWEAKKGDDSWGSSYALTSYAGHESTFMPPITKQEKQWAMSNAR